MAPVPLPAESVFASDYRVGRLLREGEASIVYVAEQLSTRALRALEVLHPPAPLDEIQSARFLRETARVTAHFSSPCVAPVLDAGIEAGQPWLVTEVFDGELLDARIARSGGLTPDEAISLLARIGRALGAAHQVGVVHGHLTPRRISLLKPWPGSESLRVLDFGVAHLVHRWAEGTAETTSAAWLSPELIRDLPVLTPAADVWSLGLIAFFMITGQRYWKSASPLDIVREALVEPLAPASARASELGAPGWPTALDAWFARCVSRDPNERFQDATEATEALSASRRYLHPELDNVICANPKGSFYDDGLKEAFEEVEPPDEDIARGEGPYRQGVRPPQIKKRVVVDGPHDAHAVLGNPKGSLYDGGHEPRSSRAPWRIVAALVLLAAVAAALRILVFRR